MKKIALLPKMFSKYLCSKAFLFMDVGYVFTETI